MKHFFIIAAALLLTACKGYNIDVNGSTSSLQIEVGQTKTIEYTVALTVPADNSEERTAQFIMPSSSETGGLATITDDAPSFVKGTSSRTVKFMQTLTGQKAGTFSFKVTVDGLNSYGQENDSHEVTVTITPKPETEPEPEPEPQPEPDPDFCNVEGSRCETDPTLDPDCAEGLTCIETISVTVVTGSQRHQKVVEDGEIEVIHTFKVNGSDAIGKTITFNEEILSYFGGNVSDGSVIIKSTLDDFPVNTIPHFDEPPVGSSAVIQKDGQRFKIRQRIKVGRGFYRSNITASFPSLATGFHSPFLSSATFQGLIPGNIYSGKLIVNPRVIEANTDTEVEFGINLSNAKVFGTNEVRVVVDRISIEEGRKRLVVLNKENNFTYKEVMNEPSNVTFEILVEKIAVINGFTSPLQEFRTINSKLRVHGFELHTKTEEPRFLEGYKKGFLVEDGAILIKFHQDASEETMKEAASFIGGNIRYEYGQRRSIDVIYPNKGSITQYKEIEDKLKARFPGLIIKAEPTLSFDPSPTILNGVTPALNSGTASIMFPNDKHAYLDQMNADKAWPVRSGRGKTVVVIDSGTNPVDDLNGVISRQQNFSSDEPVSDSLGHGTAMSGVLAGLHNNIVGTAGVSNGAKVIDFKVSSISDDGLKTVFKTEFLTAALNSVPNDIKIVSVSIAPAFEFEKELDENVALIEAVENLLERGVMVISGGGNFDSTTGLELKYLEAEPAFLPAAIPGVFTIGSIKTDFTPDSISEPYKDGSQYLDMVAPAEFVPVQMFVDSIDLATHNSSPATAMISGAAAIIHKYYPDHVKEILLASASKVNDKSMGAGYLNLEVATLNPKFEMPLLTNTNEIPWWSAAKASFALEVGSETLHGTREGFKLTEKTMNGLGSAIPTDIDRPQDKFLDVSVISTNDRIAVVQTPISYHESAAELEVSFDLAINYNSFGMNDGSEFDNDLLNSCVSVSAEIGHRSGKTGTIFEIAPNQPNVHKPYWTDELTKQAQPNSKIVMICADDPVHPGLPSEWIKVTKRFPVDSTLDPKELDNLSIAIRNGINVTNARVHVYVDNFEYKVTKTK